MHSADYAVARCPSVCLSHTSIVPKRLHISSQFFHRRVAPPFQFFHTKRHGDILMEFSLMGASNAGGVGTNRVSQQISSYRSMTAAVRTTTVTVHCTVYRTHCHASVTLCLSQPDGRPRRREREQNRSICTQR